MKRNWKTSLGGALLAAGTGLAQVDDPILAAIGQVMSIAGSLLLGYFAKDSNVTGGTVSQ